MEFKQEIFERQNNPLTQVPRKILDNLRMTDHFMADLTKIVERDKSSTAAKDLEEESKSYCKFNRKAGASQIIAQKERFFERRKVMFS